MNHFTLLIFIFYEIDRDRQEKNDKYGRLSNKKKND